MGPKLGLHEETNGSVLAEGWKTIEMLAEPVLPEAVELARTLAVPAPGPQSAVTAAPFCVTTETSGCPFCENAPKSVEKFTVVPSGTTVPFSVTMASISVHVPPFGFESLATSWIWRAVPPPPPVPGPGFVGASAAQACRPATAATRIRRMAMRRMDPPYLADAAAAGAAAEYRKIRIPLAVSLWTRWPDTV